MGAAKPEEANEWRSTLAPKKDNEGGIERSDQVWKTVELRLIGESEEEIESEE